MWSTPTISAFRSRTSRGQGLPGLHETAISKAATTKDTMLEISNETLIANITRNLKATMNRHETNQN